MDLTIQLCEMHLYDDSPTMKIHWIDWLFYHPWTPSLYYVIPWNAVIHDFHLSCFSLATGLPGNSLVVSPSLATPLPRTPVTGAKTDGKAGGNTGVTVHQIVTTTGKAAFCQSNPKILNEYLNEVELHLIIKQALSQWLRSPAERVKRVMVQRLSWL